MTMEGESGGVERRRRNAELDEVLAQVTALEGSVGRLAGSVTKIVPDQIQVGVAEIRKLFLQLVAAITVSTVVAVFVVAVLLDREAGQINHHVDLGHDVLACVLKTPEALRNDVTTLTCQQVAKER